MQKKRNKNNIFFIVIITTIFIFTLAGFLIADLNTRRLGFGQESNLLSMAFDENSGYYISLDLFGKNYSLDFTGLVAKIRDIIEQLKLTFNYYVQRYL